MLLGMSLERNVLIIFSPMILNCLKLMFDRKRVIFRFIDRSIFYHGLFREISRSSILLH